MKRFITQIFSFSIWAICIYLLMLFLWTKFAPKPMLKNFVVAKVGLVAQKVKELEKIEETDALVLGSSCAYRGYDPRIFKESGIEIFNFGTSSQTPTQTNMLVENYLTKINPKWVIYDVYPIQFGEDGIESILDFMANGMKINIFDFKSKNMKVLNTFIFSTFFNKLSTPKITDINFNGAYVAGGYVENFGSYKPMEDFFQCKKLKILPRQLKAFEQTIKTIKSRNIPFILIQSPKTVRAYKSIQNNAELDALFSKYGAYYNFNKIISLPDSLFYDDNHLNQHGVTVFNKKLIEILGDTLSGKLK